MQTMPDRASLRFHLRHSGSDAGAQARDDKPSARANSRRQAGCRTRRPLAALALCLALVGCASQPQAPEPGTKAPAQTTAGTWGGLRQAMIAAATREWGEFGRQVVVFDASEESIPEVGAWEDDDPGRSSRVSTYWRAVSRAHLDGYDCNQFWSAAFLGWIMQTAGIPPNQFTPAPTYAETLARIAGAAGEPDRYWVPRLVSEYSPRPGDIICATRTPHGGSAASVPERGTHCDLVVGRDGATLEAIGGDVRNAVSKSRLPLDGEGRLRPVVRRHWFLILENRL